MKKSIITRLIASVTAVLMLLVTFGCSGGAKEVNAEELLQTLLNNVEFEGALEDSGSSGALYFKDLPDDTTVKLYNASTYIADRLALITVADEDDVEKAKTSVEAFIAELRGQFQSYAPEQVKKFDNAIIWVQGNNIILCISNDNENAQSIIDNGGKATSASADDEKKNEIKPLKSVGSDGGYPVLTSPEDSFYDYGNGIYRVGDMAFEVFNYSESDATNYAKVISSAANAAKSSGINVYAMILPTAYGICFPDNLQSKVSSYENQGERIRQIYNQMDDSVIKIECFDNLMQHRDEYLYFKTDFHWNGTAAYYAYESWCEAKEIKPYTMDQRELKKFDGFWGALYNNNCNQDPMLSVDTVYAYCPVNDIDMTITEASGKTYEWEVIMDATDYSSSLKYATFAGGDNALTVYKNAALTDGSVGIFVKESYGNALVPYLVDHYSTLYEIDYRHWNGNIVSYANEVGAKDILFANNMSMVRNTSLIATLNEDVA